jgi:hypothetical protein
MAQLTQHYSVAQIVELHQALEKIKDDTGRWNKKLGHTPDGAGRGPAEDESPQSPHGRGNPKMKNPLKTCVFRGKSFGAAGRN